MAGIGLCYGTAWYSDKSVSVYADPNQDAEAVYRHNAAGACWAESAKNGTIKLVNGSHAVLPNGAEVASGATDLCALTADSQGSIMVSGKWYGNKAILKSGTVKLEPGTTVSVGGTDYVAAGTGATVANENGKAKLTEGAVELDAGESIYIGGAGYKVILAEGETGCTVAANGSITGLSEGNRLVLEQDGEKYEGIVSEGKFSITKDGVTKNCSLSDGGSIAEGALEKVLDEMVEELYPSDPSKPQTIRTTPGQTKTLETYNPKKDTIRLSQASGALDADKIILTEEGMLTYGDSFAQGLAENGAVVDMRQETKGVVMKDGGNGKQDTFLGGKGKDDITLGRDDVAAGGKGNDNITMGEDASGAEVVFKDGDGHDKVKNFQFGFGENANAVSLPGGQGISGASVDTRGRLKVGSATLDFVGTDLSASAQTNLLLKDARGTHKVAIGTSLTAGEELADLYYGTGKEAEVDFSDSGESNLVIDLNNSNKYGKTTASVLNVQKFKATDHADNTLVGQDGKDNTLIAGDGGSNRLYGGKGGRDRMVGSSTSEDTFYFGAMKDKVISYDLGGGLHGAKFGEKLTITDGTADFVDYYSSGSKEGDGELDISGGSDKKVWLDGSHGAVFDGFNKVDASESTGNLELAGGEQGDSILGGRGESPPSGAAQAATTS